GSGTPAGGVVPARCLASTCQTDSGAETALLAKHDKPDAGAAHHRPVPKHELDLGSRTCSTRLDRAGQPLGPWRAEGLGCGRDGSGPAHPDGSPSPSRRSLPPLPPSSWAVAVPPVAALLQPPRVPSVPAVAPTLPPPLTGARACARLAGVVDSTAPALPVNT